MWETQGDLAVACGDAFGKTMVQMIYMKDQITAAGFVDVTEIRFKWPVGPWSNDQKLKDLGRWNMHMWEQGLEGWTLALLTRYMHVSFTLQLQEENQKFFQKPRAVANADGKLQWSYDRVKEWIKNMRATLLDRKVHAYQEMYVPISAYNAIYLTISRRVVFARKPLPASSK